MFSSFPAVSKFGLFYQCMGNFTGEAEGRYVLCWSHGGRTETVAFPGHVFHPIASSTDGSIWFELVAGSRSTKMRFDPAARAAVPAVLPPDPHAVADAVSPDGRWIAFTRGPAGARELWLRAAATGEAEKIAGGRCDNGEPAWELDSSALIFASDCGRAYGLPALYRAPPPAYR
jgi:WD40-like Beta Propeller Repeat